MRAISHYFAIHADRVFEEFDVVRGGLTPMVNHCIIARQAMAGMDRRAIADFAPFGFVPEDFDIVLSRANQPGPAIWLLSFSIEYGLPMFRHSATGAMLPLFLRGLGAARNAAALMRGEDFGAVAPEIAAHLRAHFTYEGPLPANIFKDTLRQIFARAAPDTRIFVLLGNTHATTRARWPLICDAMHHQNTMIAEAATGFTNLELLAPASFMTENELAALKAAQHYERMVYHRLFQHMMGKMAQDPVA